MKLILAIVLVLILAALAIRELIRDTLCVCSSCGRRVKIRHSYHANCSGEWKVLCENCINPQAPEPVRCAAHFQEVA